MLSFTKEFLGYPHCNFTTSKGYLIYLTSTLKIVSSHDVLFDETFSNALAYISRPYSEALAIQSAVLYIMYDTSSNGQIGNIIIFSQFEEKCFVQNERNVAEDESISVLVYESSTYNDSYDRYISTNYLESIRVGKHIHPNMNAGDDILKICDHIKQAQN